MIKMEHLFDLNLQLGELVSVGQTPLGERRVAGVSGGGLDGPRFGGEVVSGSDTQLMRTDGVLEIDAAYVVRLRQGGYLRIVNQGCRHGPADVLARLARGETVDADAYFFRTVMRFETGVAELAWLNHSIAVAQAQRKGGSVEFRAWNVL